MGKARFEIYLVRHADAGDPGAWQGADADRPLSSKGTRQAERMGKFLAGIGLHPDRIVSSPKLRARQTADIVAAAVGTSVTLDDRLAEGFDLARLRAVIVEPNSSRTMLVGHDPDFSDLVAELLGTGAVPMSKSTLARIDLDAPPAPNGGRLRWLVPPDALKPAG